VYENVPQLAPEQWSGLCFDEDVPNENQFLLAIERVVVVQHRGRLEVDLTMSARVSINAPAQQYFAVEYAAESVQPSVISSNHPTSPGRMQRLQEMRQQLQHPDSKVFTRGINAGNFLGMLARWEAETKARSIDDMAPARVTSRKPKRKLDTIVVIPNRRGLERMYPEPTEETKDEQPPPVPSASKAPFDLNKAQHFLTYPK